MRESVPLPPPISKDFLHLSHQLAFAAKEEIAQPHMRLSLIGERNNFERTAFRNWLRWRSRDEPRISGLDCVQRQRLSQMTLTI